MNHPATAAPDGHPPPSSTRARSTMCARARIETALGSGPDGRLRTRLTQLRSQAPLMLFSTRAKEPEPWAAHCGDAARVSLAAGAAGPLGGDRLRLDVEVGPGSVLVLGEVSPSLLLPGRDGAASRTDVRIRIAGAGTLIWLPEPLVAARGCDHLNDVRVELADGARLLMREEVLLGRHAEAPGRVRLSTRVRRSGRPLFRQDLELGAGAGQTPAVADGYRALGSLLVVDPDRRNDAPEPRLLPGEAVLMPVPGGATLISALGDDNLALRDRLRAGLAALGPPWDPYPVHPREQP